MSTQYYGVTLLLIWLQLAGLTALAGPRLGSWALGRSCALLLIVLSLFFIEHIIGLGSLNGVWVFAIAGAGYVLWKRMPALRTSDFLKSELVFIFAVLFGFMWKASYPNIYPTGERIPDLYFIGNYVAGATLPPMDHWLPPYRFDFYFALQHYGAALLARELRMTPGLAYNFSFALLMALPLTLAWDIASRFITRRWHKCLLVAALAIGGTGTPLVSHFILEAPAHARTEALAALYDVRMWSNARLIGEYDQMGNTALANSLFPKTGPSNPDFRVLPLENFGYQYYVGDYHPPIGGFFLLMLALALIVSLEKRGSGEPERITLTKKAFLVLTVPAAAATNAWVLPLQAVLVGGWLIWRQMRSRGEPLTSRTWQVVGAAAIGGLVLIAPFLVGILSHPVPAVAFVQSHTPAVAGLILFWPLLLLIALGLFCKDMRRHALFFALVFGLLLLVSEFVFVDDLAADQYQRADTTASWWGWIWTGGLTALGATLLASELKWVRYATTAALAGTLFYVVDVYHYLDMTDERFFAHLGADAIYTQERVVSDVFQYLRESPDGIVLENVYTDDHGDGGIHGTFAGKPVVLGWPAHVIGWTDKAAEVNQRKKDIRSFYEGTLPNPLMWLRKQNVRYIVWGEHDTLHPEVRMRYRDELQNAYSWRTAGFRGAERVGVWTKRD